jgi:hypothetical protein
LIGIAGADGEIAFLGTALPVNHQFVRIARQGRPPELRFRFANTCGQQNCAHWSRDHCSLAETLVTTESSTQSADLPACGIRDSCRWFIEQGLKVCAVCRQVIRGSESVAYLQQP